MHGVTSGGPVPPVALRDSGGRTASRPSAPPAVAKYLAGREWPLVDRTRRRPWAPGHRGAADSRAASLTPQDGWVSSGREGIAPRPPTFRSRCDPSGSARLGGLLSWSVGCRVPCTCRESSRLSATRAGKRVRKHVLGHSRAEVKEKLAKVQRLQAEQRPIPDLRIRLGPFLRQWLDEVARPRVRASTLKSYREIVEGHLVPGLGNIAARQAHPRRGPGVPQPQAGLGPLASPGPVHPRRPAPRARDRGALGPGEPQRRQARRPAPGPPPRDHAAHPGAGASAHRDLRRGPLSGALDHGARHGPAPGRAAGPALGGRRPQGRAPAGPPHAGERGWHA